MAGHTSESMDKDFLIRLGLRTSEIRKSKNISQENLAYNNDISLSQIARIETGATNPTACTLKVLAEGLGVHIEELFKF